MYSKIHICNITGSIYGTLRSDPTYSYNFTTLETGLSVYEQKKLTLTPQQVIILFQCHEDEGTACKILKTFTPRATQ